MSTVGRARGLRLAGKRHSELPARKLVLAPSSASGELGLKTATIVPVDGGVPGAFLR